MVLVSLAVASLTTGCSATGRHVSDGIAPSEAAKVAELRSRIAHDPGDPQWPFRLGELYAAMDSTEQAAGALREALSADPGYIPAAILLSRIYFELRAHGAAETMLTRLLQRETGVPDEVRIALAMHLDALGNVDGARELLSGCQGNSPETLDARMFLTVRDHTSPAILDDARRAVEINPASAVAHNNYGITLLRAGRPGEAWRSLMTAVKLDRDLPGALYNLAIVETFYFFDEAAGRRWFDRYRELASEDPDNLASVLATE